MKTQNTAKAIDEMTTDELQVARESVTAQIAVPQFPRTAEIGVNPGKKGGVE